MKQLLVYILLCFSAGLLAQKKDKNLPEGNEKFNDKKFAEAEAEYRISQFQNPRRATASYNLGNAIYRQKQPSEAKHSYLEAIENAKGKKQKHKAFHNLGNVLMTEKNYQGAVEAYKNALRNNPNDEETRYNYALAKQKLKENPPKKDDQNKDKDKNKDQNKDQKPKENKDQKDQKDKNQDKNQDKKDDPKNPDKKDGKGDEDKQPQKPQPSGTSKQRMENLLEALNNEEKKIQDKIKGREVKGKPTQNEKDW